MSQIRYGRKKRLIGEINVVPYIDVMLVLLVIFMITAPLLSSGVKVDLPDAAAAPADANDVEPFVVTVDVNGDIFLNDSKSPITDVEEVKRVAQAVLSVTSDRLFMVRGDTDTDYGNVVQAMVLLQQAGVDSVGLITETPENQ